MAHRRRGRYPEAQRSFMRALAMDSAFVHAAVGLVATNGYHPIDDAAAWTIVKREGHRLTERDRALIEPRRRFLEGRSYASQLEAVRRLVALAPDRADSWHEYGDLVGDFGGLTGTADFRQRARTAYRRALELDPEFVAPMRGLIEVSAQLGDTSAVRALWPRYQQLAGGSLELETVHWVVASVLGDSSTLATLRARVPSLPPRDLLRIAERMMVRGLRLEDAPTVLRALKASAAEDYDVYRGALAAYHHHANGGRHEDALEELRTITPGTMPAAVGEAAWRVHSALFWDGDSALGRAAVPRLEAFVRDAGPDSTAELRLDITCLAATWHLVHEDTSAALPLVRQARELHQRIPADTRWGGFDVCLRTLDALRERARGDRRGPALALLDSVLAQGFEGTQTGNLIAARLHEERGDPRAALATLRRRSNHGRDGPGYLSTMLREEGRLAALTGDREGAVRAYRHFLALRPNPPERLRADTERVRITLARLEARGG
jgi:tetratricopeptide (TPR) repeat protein